MSFCFSFSEGEQVHETSRGNQALPQGKQFLS